MQIHQAGYGNNSVNFRSKKERNKYLGPDITQEYKHKERARNLKITAAALAASAAIGSYQSGYLPNFHTQQSQEPSHSVEAQVDYNEYSDLDIIYDARTDKEKLEAAKEIIRQTRADYKTLHQEVWDNFPAMYDLTRADEPTQSSFDKDYGNFYNNYSTITSIASGREKPWEDVETPQDAHNLMQKILSESSSYINRLHGEISSEESINKGELEVINKVLDELDVINPDIQAVAAIYREEIQNALENSNAFRKEHDFESGLINEQGPPGGNDYQYIDNINDLEEQSKAIQIARKNYESLKESFLKQASHSSEDTKVLYDAYMNYERLCNGLINATCQLNSNIENPSIMIYSSELREAKSNINFRLEKLTFGAPSNLAHPGIMVQPEPPCNPMPEASENLQETNTAQDTTTPSEQLNIESIPALKNNMDN